MSLQPAPPLPKFTLQFEATAIRGLADRYSYARDDRILEEIGPAARKRGHFTRTEFIDVCSWKVERSRSRVATNSEDDIVEATRLALSAKSEALRIWIPMGLSGVSWASSSVLLHFGHHDRYPIRDYRALEPLGVTGNVRFTTSFWLGYVSSCRAIADETGLTMRTIDRAMWQWSKKRSEAG